MSQAKPKQIKFGFPQEALDRLARRLEDVHLPDQPIVQLDDTEEATAAAAAKGERLKWTYGTELGKLKSLTQAWRDGNPADGSGKQQPEKKSDVKTWWRGIEERINRFPHYSVSIEDLDIHFIHVKSGKPDAIPLIFSHGWPGCFYEAHLILPILTSGSLGTAFDVVVPSLPGYALSSAPTKPGWTLADTARVFNTLMTDVLGYERYVAQGGDWGYVVTRMLGTYEACVAFHCNFVVPDIPPTALPLMALSKLGYKNAANRLTRYFLDGFESDGLKRGLEYLENDSGYNAIQSTRPASLGYALHDSPVGILSYIVEKFERWSDPRSPAFADDNGLERNPSSAVTDETILIVCSIYYLSGTMHTSFLPYKESNKLFDTMHKNKAWATAVRSKPFGYSCFPYELIGTPRSWLSRVALNCKFYKRHEYGGHFAAL